VTPDEILARASRLTLAEIRSLGASTSRLAGRFGTRRSWLDTMAAANKAADEAGRGVALTQAANAATDAIFSALTAAAGSPEASEALNASLQQWQRAVDAGNERQRRRRFRHTQRVLIRTVGFRVRGHVGPALMGTTAAVTAAATSDLATAAGPYDPEARDLLMRPWRQAID
jgi:hypothetical protein